MKIIPEDYQPPENEYASFANGTYKVKGIKWFTLDDKQRPMLKAQKDGKLVGRLRFILENGEDGPPYSLMIGDMGMLARAFGADTSKLPPVPMESQAGQVATYMQAVQEASTGKVIEVTVKDGWVSTVKGMDVPTGYFYFYIADIFPDAPKQGEYGPYFHIAYEVVAGEGGSETPYKGARFIEIEGYVVKNVNGEADWERTQSGEPTAQSKRLSNLISWTAPNIVAGGEFNPPDPNNIIPYWKENALPQKRVLKGQRVKNDKNGRVQLVTAEPAIGYNLPQNGSSGRYLDNVDTDGKARALLVKAFDYLAGEPATFGADLKLTTKGSEIAKTYITPVKQQGKVTGTSMDKLSFEDVSQIFGYMVTIKADDPVIKEFVEQLVITGVGFDAPQPEEAFEDSPF